MLQYLIVWLVSLKTCATRRKKIVNWLNSFSIFLGTIFYVVNYNSACHLVFLYQYHSKPVERNKFFNNFIKKHSLILISRTSRTEFFHLALGLINFGDWPTYFTNLHKVGQAGLSRTQRQSKGNRKMKY